MTDVTLISPSAVNLGIRSISSYLKEFGYSTRCMFLDFGEKEAYHDNSLEAIREKCADSKIIGISTIQSVKQKTDQLIQKLKSEHNTIIVGGYDASLSPEKYTYADYICIGDGEKTMLELTQNILNKNFPKERILPSNPISDLNQLPIEDYTNTEHYTINNQGEIIKLNGLLKYDNPRGDTRDSLFYITSRGCPYNCTFCEEPTFVKLNGNNKPVRSKTPEKVISELTYLHKKYPELKYIYFMDPEFFSKPHSWIEQFSKRYKSDIKIPFWTFGHPDAITKNKLDKLVEAGMKEIQIGVQSGSEETRRMYQRNTSNAKIIEIINLVKKYDVYPWIDIIFDNPKENKNNLLETINLLKELPKPYMLGTFGLELLDGAKITEIVKKDNIVYDEETSNFHNRKVAKTNEVYLNMVIRLMAGQCTEKKLGRIPIDKISILTNQQTIEFMNINTEFSKTIDTIIESNAEITFKNIY